MTAKIDICPFCGKTLVMPFVSKDGIDRITHMLACLAKRDQPYAEEGWGC